MVLLMGLKQVRAYLFTSNEGVENHADPRFDMQIIRGKSFSGDKPVAADVELDSSWQMHDKGSAHSKLC